MAFFTDLTRKIGVFGCKFYSHKNCVSVKKMTIIRYEEIYDLHVGSGHCGRDLFNKKIKEKFANVTIENISA